MPWVKITNWNVGRGGNAVPHPTHEDVFDFPKDEADLLISSNAGVPFKEEEVPFREEDVDDLSEIHGITSITAHKLDQVLGIRSFPALINAINNDAEEVARATGKTVKIVKNWLEELLEDQSSDNNPPEEESDGVLRSEDLP